MSELEEQRARAHAAREALVGKAIANGRYVLRSLVGHGGMGAVYEAEQTAIGKRVAVKFVDPEFATDEKVVARFAREARAMSAIESAHIVSVLDAGTEAASPYLVMELLRGEDLGQRLRRERRIPVADAMHILAQVLKGLARAHAAGIIHRDLKPDNVFLVKSDTDPLFAKIVDFGISKIERPRANTTPLALTGRGTVLGTPFYMAPEQAQAAADVDARADLYSVGAIIFECLTGRPPHTGESYEQVILSICMRDAPDMRAIEPKIPANVAAFVARALTRDRNERFASAERMLAALHEVAPEEKRRVPLDPGPAQTMVSAGVPTIVTPPNAHEPVPVSAATRLGVGSLTPDTERTGPPSSVRSAPVSAPVPSVSAAASAKRPPHDDAPVPPPPGLGTGPSIMVYVVAALALITGIGATFVIIGALDKKPPPAPPAVTHAHVMPSASVAASAAPSLTPLEATTITSAVAPEASTAPHPIVTPTKATSTSTPTTPSKPSAAATPAKPLDINRDLP